MSKEFKNALVCHKTGGPEMAVTKEIEGGDGWECRWWCPTSSTFHTGEFKTAELQLIEDKKAVDNLVDALEGIGPDALPASLAALPAVLAKSLKDHFASKEVEQESIHDTGKHSDR